MNRDFIFLAGEYAVSQPLVFSRDKWQHSMSPNYFACNQDGSFRRFNNFQEKFKGCIYYADIGNKSIEIQNLVTLGYNKIPCWPNPLTLLSLVNRHKVFKIVADLGYINHQYKQTYYDPFLNFPRPCVIKHGLEHRGEGKILLSETEEQIPYWKDDSVPYWKGIATIEPFFKGESRRVLIIGKDIFGLKFSNSESWIKNSKGSEIEQSDDIPDKIKQQCLNITKFLGLEIAGIDYVVNDLGWHFLEINQFPGIGSFDQIKECASIFISNKMDEIESAHN